MSAPLSKTTCLVHPDRPASARCPSCGTFYCGECITEHDGRLTCARCLAEEHREEARPARKTRLSLPLMPAIHLATGLTILWLTYYAIAQILLSVPADFHDGTVWE